MQIKKTIAQMEEQAGVFVSSPILRSRIREKSVEEIRQIEILMDVESVEVESDIGRGKGRKHRGQLHLDDKTIPVTCTLYSERWEIRLDGSEYRFFFADTNP